LFGTVTGISVKRKISGISSLIAAFFSVVFLQAEEVRADVLSLSPTAPAPRTIVAQRNVGDCACGPCAVFNAFASGNPSLNTLAASLPGKTSAAKVRALIERYGGKPSLVQPTQPRYLDNAGMWDADLVPFINDWLKDNNAPPITGERLAVQNHETPQAYLERVHNELSRSLAAGFPPVVNLQSFEAHENFFHRYWKWMDGHFVTVLSVQMSAPSDSNRFSMWVADSQSGRVLQVIVYAGPNPASGPMADRLKRSGKSTGHPVQTSPYLMIQSPRLENILEGESSKSSRSICVLQYIAHR
jgi:hypothetical protein